MDKYVSLENKREYMMRMKKKSLNIFITGLISQVVILLLGIVMPKLLIVSYGSEVNGLLSSIKQIFAYLPYQLVGGTLFII